MIGIKGARQVGKTTLMKMIYDEIKEDKAFINLDLPDMRRTLEENPLDIIKRYKKEGEKLFLFLDEIQRVRDAGEKLKIIYDESSDVKIIFSGSSSLEIKTDILPFLVGRAFIFELYSFDFEEFLSTRDKGLTKVFLDRKKSLEKTLDGNDEPQPPSFQGEFLSMLKEYLIFGGYPEVIKTSDEETKKMILSNIASLYIDKDVVNFFGIKDTLKFEDLLRFLSFRTGSLLAIPSIAETLKTTFKKVEEYLDILSHTYIIRFLRPFHSNLVTELRKTPKFYFLDTGLRNSIINNFNPFDNRTDGGVLLENFIFKELLNLSDYKINYWRTTGKAEIDFILSRGDRIIPIEVKLTGGKLGKGFHSFLNIYKPEVAFVITLNEFDVKTINSCTVYKIPAYYI
ncbi:MAG: ATP-binding protein [Thermoplasmata archaeon]|nr:ATP-binding protein [Thermoplasmata archaeon]